MKYIYLKTNQRHFFMNTVIIIFDTLGLWAQYFFAVTHKKNQC